MADHPGMLYLIVAAAGYLLGSLPTGYLVGRSRGIDIRKHGSGNIGATNVVRVLGKRLGVFVFICDALKGLAAVRLALFAAVAAFETPTTAMATGFTLSTSGGAPLFSLAGSGESFAGLLAAFGCILGHNFPVWLGFRGGKGVATTIGVLLGLMPAAMVLSAVIWFASFFLFRYVSLASLLAAVALPFSVAGVQRWQEGPQATVGTDPMFWFSVLAAVLILWRHHANIRRLLRGAEPRFDRKPVAPP